MTREPIDFEKVRLERELAGLDGDQKHWQDVRDLLFDIMLSSELSDIALTSATLSALLGVLGGETLDDNRKLVSRSLSVFYETKGKPK